jgi:hypothetical protein
MMRLTLDTDVVRDIWEGDARKAYAERLVELARDGKVDLAVTRHIEEDVPRSPLAEEIEKLPELGISQTGGVFVIGLSVLDGPDGLGSGEFDEWWRARAAARADKDPKLPGQRDYHHLHAHYIRGRDVFVTWDKAIHRLAPELEREFGILVRTPEEAVTALIE